MRKKVSTRASPIKVWFVGVVCKPNAWRRKWNTTSNRAKGVTESKSAGISVRTVSKTTIDQGADPLPTPVMRISFGSTLFAIEVTAVEEAVGATVDMLEDEKAGVPVAAAAMLEKSGSAAPAAKVNPLL